MTTIWIPASKGIRYQEYPTRRHDKKLGRYWCLQYRLSGKTVNEAVGWWSGPTFASWLVQMGTPLYTVSQLLGHSDLKMTTRYTHLAPDTQQAAAMELEGILKER
jgi:integrase